MGSWSFGIFFFFFHVPIAASCPMEKKPHIDNNLPLVSDDTVSRQNGNDLQRTRGLSCRAMLGWIGFGIAFSASDLVCNNTDLLSHATICLV